MLRILDQLGVLDLGQLRLERRLEDAEERLGRNGRGPQPEEQKAGVLTFEEADGVTVPKVLRKNAPDRVHGRFHAGFRFLAVDIPVESERETAVVVLVFHFEGIHVLHGEEPGFDLLAVLPGEIDSRKTLVREADRHAGALRLRIELDRELEHQYDAETAEQGREQQKDRASAEEFHKHDYRLPGAGAPSRSRPVSRVRYRSPEASPETTGISSPIGSPRVTSLRRRT